MPIISVLAGPGGGFIMSLTDVLANNGAGQPLGLTSTVESGRLLRVASRRAIGALPSRGFWKWVNESGVDQNLGMNFEFTVTTDRTFICYYEDYFIAEVKNVDPTKTLTFVIDPTYETLEFSYSGLTITGGGRLACEYGASELFEAMGFRFYSSAPWGTVRPATIPTNLTRARGWFWMRSNASAIAYSHAWPQAAPRTATSIKADDASELNEKQLRYEILNGLDVSAFPAGHRWTGIIGANLPWFQEIPPGGTVPRGARMLTGGMASIPPIAINSAAAKFNLTPGHLTTAEYDELVHLCAAQLLSDGVADTIFQEFHRTHMDASDGDGNLSDQFYPFTKAVGAKMRVGTAAISNKLAFAGVPDTELGVYGYAGHELPPTESCAPEVYIGAALAFKSNPDSFPVWFAKLAAKAAFGTIRDYWDTMLWSRGMPMNNGRSGKAYFNGYDEFHAAGCRGMVTENSANWLAHLVMFRWGIRKLRTGTSSWNDALDDLMAHLFNEDPAVRELYDTMWGEVSVKFSEYSLRDSFDLVNAMANGWYKTLFKQYLVICKRDLYQPPQILRANNTNWPNPMPGDPFPEKFTQLMKNVVGVRLLEPMQCWGYLRTYANTNVSWNYPALWMSRKNNTQDLTTPGFPRYTTDPDYMTDPVAPTEQDWLDEYAVIVADTPRDADLDSTDLVLVRGVVPNVVSYNPPTWGADSPHFITQYSGLYGFIGPGSVISQDVSGGVPVEPPVGEIVVQTFGPGFHIVETAIAERLHWNNGGELFLNTFPSCWREPHQPSTTALFMYVPNRVVGKVGAPEGKSFRADVRWTFHDDSLDKNGNRELTLSGTFPTRLDLAPRENIAWKDPAGLGPGQVMVENGGTRGAFYNASINKWVSKKANIVLLPRAIAVEDFPNRARVAIA